VVVFQSRVVDLLFKNEQLLYTAKSLQAEMNNGNLVTKAGVFNLIRFPFVSTFRIADKCHSFTRNILNISVKQKTFRSFSTIGKAVFLFTNHERNRII